MYFCVHTKQVVLALPFNSINFVDQKPRMNGYLTKGEKILKGTDEIDTHKTYIYRRN